MRSRKGQEEKRETVVVKERKTMKRRQRISNCIQQPLGTNLKILSYELARFYLNGKSIAVLTTAHLWSLS